MPEKPPIKELPEYKFAVSADMPEYAIQDLSNYLAGCEIEFAVEDQKKNAERVRDINNLIANQLLWLERTLDLSAEARTPTTKKIKFYKPEEWQKFVELGEINNGDEGFFNVPYKYIKVAEQSDKRRTLWNLNHEIVHALSRLTLDIEKSDNVRTIRRGRLLGYHALVSRSLIFLNEVITETINLETIDFYKRQPNGNDYSGGRGPAYYFGVIFLDMAIESIGRLSSKTHEEVRKDLYRGYFEGDPSALRIFDKTFGKGALKILASLTFDQKGYETLIDKAEVFKIDVDEFQSKILSFQSGKAMQLYSGVKIQRPKNPNP